MRFLAILALVCSAPAAAQDAFRFDGAYGGVSVLRSDIVSEEGSGSAQLDFLHYDTTGYGAFLGYATAYRGFVLGGEVAAQHLGTDDLDFTFDDGRTLTTETDMGRLLELRARVGRPVGPVLLYGAVGYAHMDTDNGDFDGPVYGVGVELPVFDAGFVGLEYVDRDLHGQTDPGVSVRLDAASLAVRAGYRF
ncbi:MAG: outer membrane protein [Hasllibacter sp.]